MYSTNVSFYILVSAHGSTVRPPGRYVPGEPGADWSEHEVEVMRQKVLKMLTEYGNKLEDEEVSIQTTLDNDFKTT